MPLDHIISPNNIIREATDFGGVWCFGEFVAENYI